MKLIPRLELGVTSEIHRVRGDAEVQAWFRAMTPEARGALLAEVMGAAPRAVAPVAAERAGSPGKGAGAPSRPAGERLQLSDAVRARLSDPQSRLVEHLDAGAELIRDGAAGQWAVYLPGGEVEPVAAQTVRVLLRAGVLKIG